MQPDKFTSQYTSKHKRLQWRQLVMTFHKSMQSNHWNGYLDTRFNARLGTRVLKYLKIRALIKTLQAMLWQVEHRKTLRRDQHCYRHIHRETERLFSVRMKRPLDAGVAVFVNAAMSELSQCHSEPSLEHVKRCDGCDGWKCTSHTRTHQQQQQLH